MNCGAVGGLADGWDVIAAMIFSTALLLLLESSFPPVIEMCIGECLICQRLAIYLTGLLVRLLWSI